MVIKCKHHIFIISSITTTSSSFSFHPIWGKRRVATVTLTCQSNVIKSEHFFFFPLFFFLGVRKGIRFEICICLSSANKRQIYKRKLLSSAVFDDHDVDTMEWVSPPSTSLSLLIRATRTDGRTTQCTQEPFTRNQSHAKFLIYTVVVKKAAEGEGGGGTATLLRGRCCFAEQREADQTRTGNKFEYANMIIKV